MLILIYNSEQKKCGAKIQIKNINYELEHLNGVWTISKDKNGTPKVNDDVPYYEIDVKWSESSYKKFFMWWMKRDGETGYWVINETPGKHGDDQMSTMLGEFACPYGKPWTTQKATLNLEWSISQIKTDDGDDKIIKPTSTKCNDEEKKTCQPSQKCKKIQKEGSPNWITECYGDAKPVDEKTKDPCESCSHGCTEEGLTKDNYKCSCPFGSYLGADKHTCEYCK
jgi:hypothetical protein